MPRTFTVTVLRTAYAEQDIEVEADDAEEAKQLALDRAGDYCFSEHEYEYDVQAVTEHPAPPASDPEAAKMPAPPEIPDATDAWL